MRFFKTNRLLKLCFPGFEWDKLTPGKKIYLTFDDGPIPEVTEFVLDTLAAYQAKATFFCVGDNIRKYPHIFRKIIEQNHSIGNHTFNHLNGWETENQAYFENIRQCEAIFNSQLTMPNDQKPLFRPPYGKIKSAQMKVLKDFYRIIMWDVLTYDFDKNLPKEICLKKAIRYTGKGSIVVFHDSIKSEQKLRFVLPQYLEYFSTLGFSFEKL